MLFKESKSSNHFLFECYDYEDNGTNISYGYVHIYPGLFDKIRKFKLLLEKHDDIYEINSWDHHPYWFKDYANNAQKVYFISEEIPDQLDYIMRVDEVNPVHLAPYCERTQTDLLNVTKHHFYWSCHIKHTNILVTSPHFKHCDFKELQ